MVFSRFFRDKRDAQPGGDADDTAADEQEQADDADDDESGVPEEMHEPTWSERASQFLPSGVSTGSKRADAMYGEAAADAPTHFTSAIGCRIVTAEGDTLVDCTMALGAVAIGYAEPNITRQVMDAVAAGNVSGLSHTLEVDVAERFCEMVPCAERVQFLKTGAEAVSAAVRIARTYTGRDVVIGSGYFGWHDWSSSAAGVPAGVTQDYRAVPFDDVAALEQAAAAAGDRLAAIVLEPVVERMPSEPWIAKARALCDAARAVLIFDEIKTGFRLAPGGYQEYANITPDLAAFGKALANGYPLSAVCGRADIMDAARRTWISSTLASESSALAAALAVTEIHRQAEVCPDLWSIGKAMRDAVEGARAASGVEGVRVEGVDPMWFLRFDSSAAEARFVRHAVAHGVLFKRGAYNFASLAHDEDALRDIEAAASNAFVAVRDEMAGGE